MQIHDAILIQYPEDREDDILPCALGQIRQRLELEGDRDFIIPYGVATGWNWGKYDAEKNPDGLRSYISGDKRKRAKKVSILDRPVRRVYRQH